MKRRNFLGVLGGTIATWPHAVFAQGARELQPLATAKTALVRFENSPFPYRGEVPEKNKPFLDAMEGERRGHTSPQYLANIE